MPKPAPPARTTTPAASRRWSRRRGCWARQRDPLPADVIFAAFSAEEVGKLGSAAYVRDSLAAGRRFRAVIALDTVGGAGGAETAGAVRAFSADPVGSPSRQLARHLDVLARASLPILDVQVQDALDRPYRYSDHVPFSDAGFAAARLIEPVEDPGSNHSPADLPANLTPEILRHNTQLAVAAAAHLAAGPPPPDPTFVDGALQWEAVPGAAAYVVAFRAEGKQAFGAVMQVSAGSTALPLDAADGEDAYASVAALSAEGWMGPFSAEIGVTPGE